MPRPECPNCHAFLDVKDGRLYCNGCGNFIVNNGGTYVTEEKYEQLKAQGEVAGAAIALLLLVGVPIFLKLIVWLANILWKILCGLFELAKKLIHLLFKLITFPVIIMFRKPKVVLPIYGAFTVIFVATLIWYNSAEQRYIRAEKYLQVNEKLDEALSLLAASAKEKYLPAMVMQADILLHGKYHQHANPAGAYVLLKEAAKLGSGNAWYLKGVCLENGQGAVRNLTEAHECYQKAVEAGYAEAKQSEERTAEIAKWWTPAQKENAEAQYNLGLCYASGNGITADDAVAREWFTKSANGGFAPAQVILCTWMIEGRGGPEDSVLGLSYCEKAAKQDYPEAYTKLGEYYYEGKVVSRDYTKAIKYLSYASKKGSASAAFKLGFCFRNGYGSSQNQKEAFKYFQLSAERNYAPGQYALGECYEFGYGIPVDYTKALAAYTSSAKSDWTNADLKKSRKDADTAQKRLEEIGKWWAPANEKNDAQAQCNVGTCYFTGNGVKKDLAKALVWFKKAADQNNLEGIVRVADCQFYGYGVKQDPKAAVGTYQEAAEKGQSYAMFRLGQCYETGNGIEQNLTSAYNWYQKAFAAKYQQAGKEANRIKEPGIVWDEAIKNNNAEAQYRLACCYYFGDSGLDKDLKKAFEWFKKSSDQGFVKATHNLGFCYLKGEGTEQNMELMKKCFLKAAEKDFPPSLCVLGEMYQKGVGFEQNLTTAYKYYAKAASHQEKMAMEQLPLIKEIAKVWDPAHKGNAKAQYLLAHCYSSGNGIEKNVEKAEEWFLKSANQGYADAQYDLAESHALHAKDNKDKEIIASWLIKAAQSGHIRAMVRLGQLYYNGEGVKEDYDKSVELWEKAVKAKNADAMYLLGKHRFTGRGLFNSGKDVDKAIALWADAVALGHVDAAYELAEYYYHGVGLLNSGKDRGKALSLYEKAAQSGHLEAMFKFWYCLFKGMDIEEDYKGIDLAKDKIKAEAWLEEAASKGHEEAKEYLSKRKK